MTFHFIVNPIAGKAQYQEVITFLANYQYHHPNFSYEVYLTQKVGHARKIAQEITTENDVVVSVGGDGTLNEVVNGLHEQCILGVVPNGTGNDFSLMLDYPQNLSMGDWLRETIEGKIVEVDLGEVNGQKFINSCNTGLDSDVLVHYDALREKYKNFRKLSYISAILKTIKNLEPYQAKITVDGQRLEDQSYLVATTNNGKYYGGGFKPTPRAEIQDGLLDFCLIRPIKKYRLPYLLSKFQRGSHEGHEVFELLQAQTVEIETNEPVNFALDGELQQGTSIRIRVLPKAVRIQVSAQSKLM